MASKILYRPDFEGVAAFVVFVATGHLDAALNHKH
jgi:hypothetical protein